MRFSPKQRQVLLWWRETPAYEGIICDGAVRSGKTLCMGIGFFCWAMGRFDKRQFALCGKTIGALRRNVLQEVLPVLRGMGMTLRERRGENLLTVSGEGHENRFYLVGGKDEGSAALIQGATFAGVLLDEAALMPRSFVEQALARCSVEGAKLWFSCNPEGPGHWFYREWILRAEERRVRYLHFTMEDNPGLSPEVRAQYERRYTGAFYRRFVLGEWTAPEGRIYDFYQRSLHARPRPAGEAERWCVSVDYGTANPCSMGLWGKYGDVWYRVEERYYAAGETGVQRTDQEYVEMLKGLTGGRRIERIVADPSAASFITALRREGFLVTGAVNDVLSGIRLTAGLLKSGRLVICEGCEDCLREMEGYCWERPGGGREAPGRRMTTPWTICATSPPPWRGERPSPASAAWRWRERGVRRASARKAGGPAPGQEIKEVCMGLWRRKTAPEGAACTQLRRPGADWGLLPAVRMGSQGQLYRAVRAAVPAVDAAVGKIIRLVGGVSAVCEDREAQTALGRFLKTVPVGRGQVGINAFLDMYLDSMLTFGQAVGEIVLTRERKDIAALLCGRVEDIEVRQGDSPLEFTICGRGREGRMEPLPRQELLLFTPYSPEADNPYGVSMLRGMPFLTELLGKIYTAMGANWERMGNVRFAVVYKPQGGEMDPAACAERSRQIAREWSRAMESGRDGSVRDFVAIGDVEIKVIGADNQILDSEVPVRQILEQLVAKTGIPPFMLGLSWSSTERMSTQQADILTSELTAIRRGLTPVVERVCRLWLRLHGWYGDFSVVWDDINLQDQVEEAKAEWYRQQARQIAESCERAEEEEK